MGMPILVPGETSPYTSLPTGAGQSAASLLAEGVQLGVVMDEMSKRCASQTNMPNELDTQWEQTDPDGKRGLAQVRFAYAFTTDTTTCHSMSLYPRVDLNMSLC